MSERESSPSLAPSSPEPPVDTFDDYELRALTDKFLACLAQLKEARDDLEDARAKLASEQQLTKYLLKKQNSFALALKEAGIGECLIQGFILGKADKMLMLISDPKKVWDLDRIDIPAGRIDLDEARSARAHLVPDMGVKIRFWIDQDDVDARISDIEHKLCLLFGEWQEKKKNDPREILLRRSAPYAACINQHFKDRASHWTVVERRGYACMECTNAHEVCCDWTGTYLRVLPLVEELRQGKASTDVEYWILEGEGTKAPRRLRKLWDAK